MRDKLRKRRRELGLTQQQAADYIGIKKSTYYNYEHKFMSTTNKNAKKIIASGFLGDAKDNYVRGRLERRKKQEREKHRIPNIPNFYERLDALCGEDGRLYADEQSAALRSLQEDLGVITRAVDPDHVINQVAVNEQIEFGELVLEFRGERTQSTMAEQVGISSSEISAVERGQRGSGSEIVKNLPTHDFFTASQQIALQKVYKRMRMKEMEQ